MACDAVKKHKADLGVIFDTDVDRSGIVDQQGKAINKNGLIALMSAITLRQHPETTIVTDSVTSTGLTKFITKLGGKHFRFKRGYKNVINKGIELNKEGVECHLMMETSGHGALKENRYLDDGAYMAVKVIIEAARRRWEGFKDVSQMLTDLEEPEEEVELRMKVLDYDWSAVAADVLEKFEGWVDDGKPQGWEKETPNYEGVRISTKADSGDVTGWLLMRSSLHDPLLVVNAESEKEGGVKPMLQQLLDFFKEHGFDTKVDLGKLTSHLEA
eukprot:TRINITY_DN48958_c0_g1_i1.p1 TRINITY_DN48958_c0_g1~~TRINITY_DN48958_c0_g1_i1.p1  ORF type:complete len:272 (-),score=44.19 TRINITY_DN48958_c0_g1_i1:113-928(-)